MNANEYLKTVAITIATHGHRGNAGFIEAAHIANGAIRHPTDAGDPMLAKAARDEVEKGLKYYQPIEEYFSPAVAVEYATLVAKFNTLEES